MRQAKAAKIKLNLKELSLDDTLNQCKQVLHALTGNEDFPNPNPTLEEFQEVIKTMEKLYSDVLNTRKVLAAQQSKLEDYQLEVIAVLKQFAAYVENVSKGDESKIKAAGFGTRSSATKQTVIDAPKNLHVVSVLEGEASLSWNAVSGAKSYAIQITKDISGSENWEHAGISTKSKGTVNNLSRKTNYWFRVAAVGSAGQGPWGEPCAKFIV